MRLCSSHIELASRRRTGNTIRGLEAIMFNPTQIIIQAFVGELKNRYGQIYGILEPAHPDIIGFVGRLAYCATYFRNTGYAQC